MKLGKHHACTQCWGTTHCCHPAPTVWLTIHSGTFNPTSLSLMLHCALRTISNLDILSCVLPSTLTFTSLVPI